MFGDRLAAFVVVVVVVVWAVTTVILPLVIPGYVPPPTVGTAIGVIAGGAVAVVFARRGSNGKNGDKHREEDDE